MSNGIDKDKLARFMNPQADEEETRKKTYLEEELNRVLDSHNMQELQRFRDRYFEMLMWDQKERLTRTIEDIAYAEKQSQEYQATLDRENQRLREVATQEEQRREQDRRRKNEQQEKSHAEAQRQNEFTNNINRLRDAVLQVIEKILLLPVYVDSYGRRNMNVYSEYERKKLQQQLDSLLSSVYPSVVHFINHPDSEGNTILAYLKKNEQRLTGQRMTMANFPAEYDNGGFSDLTLFYYLLEKLKIHGAHE